MSHHSLHSPVVWLLLSAFGVGACGDDEGAVPNVPDPSGPETVIRLTVASAPEAGLVGVALTSPVVVRATRDGVPAAGQPVSFSLVGSGSLAQLEDTTDAEGLASPGAWTLGTRAGLQRLLASSGGTTITIDVQATSSPSAIDSLIAPSGMNNGDFVAGRVPTVGTTFVAVDSFHNRLGAGIPVRWTALEGTLDEADSLTTTNALGAVTPHWTLSTLIGSQRLVARYTTNDAPNADTVTVNAICARTPLALGSSVGGQWRVTDCRTETQRRDEYAIAVSMTSFVLSDMRAITLAAGDGRTLQLRGVEYVQMVPPTYLDATSSTAVEYRYILDQGNYVVEAQSPALEDAVHTISVSGSLSDEDGYWARVGCVQAGNVPVFVSRNVNGFNFHDAGSNVCSLGGLGTYQDRYLIQLQAGQELVVTLRHGTTGANGLATPQFVLNLRDASTAGGPVVATAATPATPNGDENNAWIVKFTAAVDGLYEIVVGTGPQYNLAAGMDYELLVQ